MSELYAYKEQQPYATLDWKTYSETVSACIYDACYVIINEHMQDIALHIYNCQLYFTSAISLSKKWL